ncbi:MAG TPA: SBBP repeat-containing protein [Bryobacteraceae bacterium]|nr:SBBP repeat-containing protein [Bryobacteraceae bacterium]
MNLLASVFRGFDFLNFKGRLGMSTHSRVIVSLALSAFAASAQSALTLSLEWVTSFGGSGSNEVTGAAADISGNLYVVGTTSSVDLTVTGNAAQPNAGGSPLIRIDGSTAAAQLLYPAGLSNLNGIAADPENPQTLYALQANTIWKSVDAGSTWASLSSLLAGATANFIVVDEFHSNVLYAATSPLGVFKSVDSGVTWAAANNGIPPNNSGALNVWQVWSDPTIAQVVFALSDKGFLRSADAGATWQVTVHQGVAASTVAFDASSPGVLYAVTNFSTVVSKSTDNGLTFLSLPALLPDKTTPAALVVDPIHRGTLYAGSGTGIFATTDDGATWVTKAKIPGLLFLADPNRPVLYALSENGIVASGDGFATTMQVGPTRAPVRQMVAGGSSIFARASVTTDVFIAKFDPNGKLVYASYLGGVFNDAAAAMALGSDGSVYVAGSTLSVDFPTTKGVYQPSFAFSTFGSNFLTKLNPDGSLAWSTYFSDGNTSISAIAVDPAGNVFIGGVSGGNLPTTPGAYETTFTRSFLGCGGIGPCIPGPPAGFVTKFTPNGSALTYSTYISMDANMSLIESAQALVLDGRGNAYFGGSTGNVSLLNASGSSLLASVNAPVNVTSMARDAVGNVYSAGFVNFANISKFSSTSGAFQPSPQPPIPSLPGELGAGGGSDAFVMKWSPSLTQVLAATLIGGEMNDAAADIAVDPAGTVIVTGYTDSRGFPTRAPFQEPFSPRSGFVAGLDSSLSQLLFSTYLGDQRPFLSQATIPDGQGNILMAGFTLTTNGAPFIGGQPGPSYDQGQLVVVNKIALGPAPAPRLDSVVNVASHLAAAIAPGEAIALIGSGFGAGAQILIDGASIPVVSATPTSLTAVMPASAKTLGTYQIQVSLNGALSNTVQAPAAPASPGIYTADGPGYGQGYILNSDGTLNSPSNPARPNYAITIFATGEGQFSLVDGFAVTALTPAVFIDGFYADGIAAVDRPVTGFVGNVYQISVTVPDPAMFANFNPNLKDFKYPPQVPVTLVFGPVNPLNPANSALISQMGVALSVRSSTTTTP